jgi:hypothetical protein
MVLPMENITLVFNSMGHIRSAYRQSLLIRPKNTLNNVIPDLNGIQPRAIRRHVFNTTGRPLPSV